MRKLLILAVVLVVAGLFFRQKNVNFLNIKLVEVNLNKADCTNADEVRKTAKLFGQNILLMNSAHIKDSLKSRFLCVNDVQISRRPPNKVTISVSGRQPFAELAVLAENEATGSADPADIATPSASLKQAAVNFLVDNEGIIYAKAISQQTEPKIYYNDGSLELGQKPESILSTVKILKEVNSYGLDISESEVLDDSLVIFPGQSGAKLIFKLTDDLDVKLASLQLILGQAKINGNQLEFIDLRFDKPIVKFAPKKKNG